MTIRLGVVGYNPRNGRGRDQFAACAALDGVERAAICDIRREVRDHAVESYPGVRFFTDYQEMFDAGAIDAVLVETPPQFHAECSIAALDRNIHVLCDCPALHRIEEAPALWDAVHRSAATYMFGENMNYYDYVRACSQLMRDGRLGDPFYLEAEYVHDLGHLVTDTPWRRTYEPIRYCTHSLGPVLEWVEEDLTSVSCFDTASHINRRSDEHDAMVAIFRTASNVVVKVLVTFINNHPIAHHRFTCHGTKGYFERTGPIGPDAPQQRSIFYSREMTGQNSLSVLSVNEGASGGQSAAPAGGHGGTDGAMLADFLEAVAQGRPSPIDVRKALRMTLPGLYALESARQGGALLTIEYPWSRCDGR